MRIVPQVHTRLAPLRDYNPYFQYPSVRSEVIYRLFAEFLSN